MIDIYVRLGYLKQTKIRSKASNLNLDYLID